MRKIIILVIMSLVHIIGLAKSDTSVSASFRNSILPEKPFDYELRLTKRVDKDKYIFLFEREVGIEGFGCEIKHGLPKIKNIFETTFEWYAREAEGINYQELEFILPYKDEHSRIKYGFSLSLDHWGDPRVMADLKIRLMKYAKFDLSTNFIDRQIMKINISERYYIGEKAVYREKYGKKYGMKYYIEPLARYKAINEKIQWQIKLSVGVEI